MTPRVSVIVPVFDDAIRLRRCVESILAQREEVGGQLEVLVADNGSSDDPAGALAGLDDVCVVHEPRPGSYAARNRAASSARGDVLAFTDADCVPRLGWLRAGLAKLDGPPAMDIVVGEIELFDETESDGRPTDPVVQAYETVTAFRQRHYAEVLGFGPTANLFVRRSTFAAVGGFDPSLLSSGDKVFGQRAVATGHRLGFAPEAVVGHPFRGTRQHLEAKVRRLVGGDTAAAGGRWIPTLRNLGRYVSKPWRTCASLWHGRRERPLRTTLAVAALALRVTFWQLHERLRLALGNEARR